MKVYPESIYTCTNHACGTIKKFRGVSIRSQKKNAV